MLTIQRSISREEGVMASVDDVKAAIEEAVPGRAPRRRRLPAALLMGALAGLLAWASRLEPVRAAVGSAASGVRSRVASLRGSGDAAAQASTEWSPAATALATERSASDTDASDLAASSTPTDATAGSDAGADAPVGIGFDDAAGTAASPESIPADTEEGRPAGV